MTFIHKSVIHSAVLRLAKSRALPTLTDYLIFKRALVIANELAAAANQPATDLIVTGTSTPSFTRAVSELAATVPPGLQSQWAGHPFFSPFGASRDTGRGFKGPKYPSNGPADTASGWQARSASSPLARVDGSRPRAFRVVERSAEELQEFFLAKTGGSPRPLLVDFAIWRFRASDLGERWSQQPNATALCEGLIEDLGLNSSELAVFNTATEQIEELSGAGYSSAPAEPTAYLPAAPSAGSAALHTSISVALPHVPSVLGPPEIDGVIEYVRSRGYVFEPWQIAAYITAVRTKPFVILAGISGTGKTQLPTLVAQATGAVVETVPVRPNWTDSSDLIGYERLNSTFVAGPLLQLAKVAMNNPEKQYFLLLDEMNVARVEYYLAEVLSRLEQRVLKPDGRFVSPPLLPDFTSSGDELDSAAPYRGVGLPSNLCLVGSVNMDETTHGFSKKVLDRGFVIEFSEVDLNLLGELSPAEPASWSAADWRQAALTLPTHPERDSPLVGEVIESLSTLNEILAPAQLQVGYRVRDEVAMFQLVAQHFQESFVTSATGPVDPLDLAVAMKVLPRIQGGGAAIKRVLTELMAWAAPTDETKPTLLRAFPFCQARIDLMRTRLDESGFASYWL